LRRTAPRRDKGVRGWADEPPRRVQAAAQPILPAAPASGERPRRRRQAMRKVSLLLSAGLTAALAVCLARPSTPTAEAAAQGGDWGDIKGQVVWAGDKVPVQVQPDMDKAPQDKPVCLAEAKNTAPMPHNYKIDSPPANPSLNQLLPPGKTLDVKDWKAANAPSKVSCTIHGWMNGYVRVFNHPYYAVTDADGNFEIKGAPA